MVNIDRLRKIMIENHLMARGIGDPAVLRAMEEVPREKFLPDTMVEFAYEDSPLPIGEGQTISQPYMVAVMTQLLELDKDDRVLEVGTGSGYAAAILSRIVDDVYTVERHRSLADAAKEKFDRLGYGNIHVLHGDGTLGWPENAPYDAIVVTAGAPDVPESLLKQLAVGGRLVIPAGSEYTQELVRIRRIAEDEYEREEQFSVRFVPLVGAEGWKEKKTGKSKTMKYHESRPIPELIARTADAMASIEEKDIRPLLDRIGDAKVVLLGEATHGTAEFYEMRARITRDLIEKKGFNIVAIEADWPDVSQIDRYIKGIEADVPLEKPFKRFPTWMWSNVQFSQFVESLRAMNLDGSASGGTSLYGLDLYSLHNSIGSVLQYLDGVDPETAAVARHRYGCLTPWQKDPARPSHRNSYEYLCHQAEMDDFLLPLRHASAKLIEALSEPRLERAIGVIYSPETELQSHYFQAELPRQFDEYIWFDETRAVTPLGPETPKGLPETFPFGV